MTEVVLRETIRPGTPYEYVTEWRCEPPEVGQPYRVVRQEWAEDYAVRRIFDIELLDAAD